MSEVSEAMFNETDLDTNPMQVRPLSPMAMVAAMNLHELRLPEVSLADLAIIAATVTAMSDAVLEVHEGIERLRSAGAISRLIWHRAVCAEFSEADDLRGQALLLGSQREVDEALNLFVAGDSLSAQALALAQSEGVGAPAARLEAVRLLLGDVNRNTHAVVRLGARVCLLRLEVLAVMFSAVAPLAWMLSLELDGVEIKPAGEPLQAGHLRQLNAARD